jgi:DtxR family transcriptional regulator, Mn-dependent transcriptional regulator
MFKRVKVSISKEDYIKAIAEAEIDGDPVIAATLKRWMNVTPAAVTMALRRLKRDGFVEIKKDGRLVLTTAGRSVAERIRVRHHLIERMLVEFFGMEWFKVHDEAERLEHAVSDDFLAKLIERLGPGGRCPHGNDIRADTPDDRRKRGWVTLSEQQPGETAVIVSVFERDRRLLEHFDKLGIRPGVTVRVIAHNSDETLTLQVESGEIALGRSGAQRVWVASGCAQVSCFSPDSP